MKTGSLCKIFALFLIVVLLATRLSTYTHEMFAGPIQEYISNVPAVCADDETPQKTPYLFKVKRLSSDIASHEPLEIITLIVPAIETQLVLQSYSMPPEVYLDILVPPDETSLAAV